MESGFTLDDSYQSASSEKGRLSMNSKRWTISDRQIAAMLETSRIVISSGSPLLPVTKAKPLDRGSRPKRLEPELRQSLEVVAQPSCEIRLLVSSPSGNGTSCFYSGAKEQTGVLVGHDADKAGNHQFVWTSEEELLPEIRSTLQLNVPTEPSGISLDISPATYQTLLGLVDCTRDGMLRSLLERSPIQDRRFTTNQVFDVFRQNCSSKDWRWLVASAKAISPFQFNLSEAECQQGLRELADRGLLEEQKDSFTLSATMQMACARISSPVAYCALNKQRLIDGKQAEPENLIALRGMGTLWLIQFEGLHSPNLRVRIRDASGEDVDLAISEKFHNWTSAPHGIAPGFSPMEERHCPSCGNELAAEAIFCSNCGTNLQETKKSSVQCPSCRAPIPDLTASFCPKCGKPLAKKETRSRSKDKRTAKSKLESVDRKHMETLARALQYARTRHTVSDADFKSLHDTLKSKDSSGTVWTVGLKSIKWHRLNNHQWVHGDAPMKLYIDKTSLARLEKLEQPPVSEARVCQTCGALLQPGKKFCTGCGARITEGSTHKGIRSRTERHCPKCNAIVPPGKKFCTADGTPVP